MMTTDTDWLGLCDNIDDGEFDEGLDEIARAVSSRRDIVHRRNARRMQREIAVGDKVRLTNKVTPRYLEGCIGVILQIRDGAAVVMLDDLPTHRGRPSADGPQKKLLVEFVHLVKVDPDVMSLKSVDLTADIGDDDEYEDPEDDE